MRYWYYPLIAVAFLFAEAQAGLVPLSKAKAFLQKKRVCDFAVGYYNRDEPGSVDDPAISGQVYCVVDAKQSSGTVYEKSGCTFLEFDVESGRLQKPSLDIMIPKDQIETVVSEGQSCSGGGFEKVLESKIRFQYQPKVKEILHGGPSIGFPLKTVVLFSRSKSFEASFNQATAQIETERRAAETEAAKRKQEADERARLLNEQKQKAESDRLKKLDGLWVLDCYEREPGLWATEKREYHGGNYSYHVTTYKDSGCAEKLSTTRAYGTFKAGALVNAKESIREIDFIAKKVTFTAHSDAVVNALTEQSSFGIVNWVIGKENDVSKSNDFKDSLNRTLFSIFRLDGKNLYLADTDPSKLSVRENRSLLQVNPQKIWKRE